MSQELIHYMRRAVCLCMVVDSVWHQVSGAWLKAQEGWWRLRTQLTHGNTNYQTTDTI
jgi:hypothetical protein